MPYHLEVSLFNAAGEKVRLLFSGSAAALPSRVTADRALFILEPGQQAALDLGAALSSGGSRVFWEGDNDSGQDVSGGLYYFKAEYRDSFGASTTLIQEIQVAASEGSQVLGVYNSAGELVYSKNLSGSGYSALALSAGTLVSGDAAQGFSMELKDERGLALSLPWDGRGNAGQVLESGTYTVRLESARSGAATAVLVKSLSILKSPTALPTYFEVGPNPAGPGVTALELRFAPEPGAQASAGLYNQAGELIRQARDLQGMGAFALDIQDLAPGIYVAVLEKRQGSARIQRLAKKLALIR